MTRVYSRTTFSVALAMTFALLGTGSPLHASEVATATISFNQINPTTYHYSVTLTDAGTTNIGTFWFAWVPGADFMPTSPANVVSPASWTSVVTNAGPSDGYAIQWVASAAAPLTPGQSLPGFAFDSTTTPTQMMGSSPFFPGTPVLTSYVYPGAPLQGIGLQFQVTAAGSGLDFYPVTPCRVADTRVSSFGAAFGPPSMAGGASRTFNILSSPCANGIPSSAAAYSLNFTVVPPGGGPAANLTTWPAGLAMPNVSTLNYSGGVVANAAIVPAGTNGAITVFATNATDMLFDINGYFAPPGSGLEFYPVTPCRVADTRVSSFGAAFGPPSMAGGATRTFNIPNSPCAAGIPASVAAYSFNFTVVPPTGGPAANLTTWPTGLATGIPNVSTLNYSGLVVANAAIVPSGSGNAINVFVNDPTNVLFDINGYFAPPASSSLKFYPVTPCRVADTRVSSFGAGFGPPSLGAGSTRAFNILSSSCAAGFPSNIAAYSLNFTVVPPSGGTAANLTTWPAGLAIPNVSTLNYYGAVVANAAIVPAGTNGAINVFVTNPTDVVFDINGYFAP